MPPKLKAKDDGSGEEKLTRIAVISGDRCKPKKCKQECKKSCPVVKIGAPGPEGLDMWDALPGVPVARGAARGQRRVYSQPPWRPNKCTVAAADVAPGARCCAGKLCIEVTPASKIAFLSEELCIGCGICVKVGA